MKNVFLLLVFNVFIFNSIYSQVYWNGKSDETFKLIPEKNKENGLWGVQNRNGEWKIKPVYKKVKSSYFDTLFIMKSIENNKYGAVDSNGDTVVNFVNHLLVFNEDTAVIPYSIMSMPIFFNGKVNYRVFNVDINGQCISQRYYPCPYGSKLSETEKSESLRQIELAEKFLYNKEIPNAINCYKKAIEISPNDPFVYLWTAQSLVFNQQYEDISYENNMVLENAEFIKSCINKAIELERNEHYQIRLKRIEYLYYKHIENNNAKVNDIENWYKEYKRKNKDNKHLNFWWKFDYMKH